MGLLERLRIDHSTDKMTLENMRGCTFALPFVLTLSSCPLGNLGLRPFSGDLVGLPPGFLGLPAFLGLPKSFSSIVCGVVPPDVLRDEFAVLDYNQIIIFPFHSKFQDILI